ncbi:NADH-quinone oxidoreductase subunit NuoH [Solitalea canadensis]|uniref:NADH-quinone oxidoreductase subunit H n=1 Tax=Solitalea canadensis (strain ATCC 29591 / DSM 3403 / JCM 21819 / LMG 8368 / NBRC 15130 / NCIMB 12057 / USAM 9D) TaxID=929556 RepID=H8KMD8_SOLCM|nr:NADH-quinone oxidoreductase subunit NuoH [Solitalea canadensis]AFD08733.1 NADH:ubiquinone oxidoreductase subunit 1 (chain H) [Solitalea canadensis DSM 3403]
MELAIIIEKFSLITIVLLVSLVVAMYMTLVERRFAAFFQDRLGPNRAGPFGLLQPLADGVKLFTKEEILPTNANKLLFVLGPSLAMFTATITSAVIPWGKDLTFGDRTISLQVADINIGVLYIFGVVSLGVYGMMVGGWASNNKYSLMGAIRAASQSISYEIAMGMAIIALLMVTGTLSVRGIVEGQSSTLWGISGTQGLGWNVFYQPLAFMIYLICMFAECNRTPFDLPECESELVAGYHTEHSSMKLGFYLFAEYINMFVSSAVVSALFFGGYNFPGQEALAATGIHTNWIAILGVVAFFLKIAFFLFFFVWVRWTIPRFRYDQLMRLGWNMLVPLAIANIGITGLVMYFTGHIN